MLIFQEFSKEDFVSTLYLSLVLLQEFFLMNNFLVTDFHKAPFATFL